MINENFEVISLFRKYMAVIRIVFLGGIIIVFHTQLFEMADLNNIVCLIM